MSTTFRRLTGTPAFLVAVVAFTLVMMGTTLPTPLYAIYGRELDFGVLVTTLIFAVYVLGTFVALLLLGGASDIFGRRPLLIVGGVASVISAIIFLTAGPVWQLMLGRVFSGFSAGIFTGTATAAVIELAPPSWKQRAPAIATAANIGGLGLGPLLAGFFAEYAPSPLHSTFVFALAAAVVSTVGVWAMREPTPPPPGAKFRIQRLSVPPPARPVFIPAAIAVFAGFAVLGTFAGVAPSFLARILDQPNHAVAGAVVAAMFLASAATQVMVRSMPTLSAMLIGCAILAVGMGVVVAGLALPSLTWLVVGAVIAGVGQGMSFSKGLAAVVADSPVDRRAEVTSALFFIGYIAISVPIVGQGLAATQWSLDAVGIAFAAGVGVLAVIALGLMALAHRHRPVGAAAPVPDVKQAAGR